METKSFVLWFDCRDIFSIWIYIPKSIQQSVSLDPIVCEHHPSIVDSVTSILMTHVSYLDPWISFMVGVSNICDEGMYSLIDSFCDQLSPYDCFTSSFGKMSNPNFDCFFMRSVEYELLWWLIISCGRLNSLDIWAMRELSQSKTTKVFELTQIK